MGNGVSAPKGYLIAFIKVKDKEKFAASAAGVDTIWRAISSFDRAVGFGSPRASADRADRADFRAAISADRGA